jgi:hypothetical protein
MRRSVRSDRRRDIVIPNVAQDVIHKMALSASAERYLGVSIMIHAVQ